MKRGLRLLAGGVNRIFKLCETFFMALLQARLVTVKMLVNSIETRRFAAYWSLV